MDDQHHTTILIVDDHDAVREGIKALIAPEADMRVIGEAANGMEGVKAACALMPDIIIMDILMPEMDGWNASEQILKAIPSARILILSNCDEREYAQRAMKMGAAGFVRKNQSINNLRTAIRNVANGSFHF